MGGAAFRKTLRSAVATGGERRKTILSLSAARKKGGSLCGGEGNLYSYPLASQGGREEDLPYT